MRTLTDSKSGVEAAGLKRPFEKMVLEMHSDPRGGSNG